MVFRLLSAPCAAAAFNVLSCDAIIQDNRILAFGAMVALALRRPSLSWHFHLCDSCNAIVPQLVIQTVAVPKDCCHCAALKGSSSSRALCCGVPHPSAGAYDGSMSGSAWRAGALGSRPPLEFSDHHSNHSSFPQHKQTKTEGETQPDLPPDQFGPVGMGFPSESTFSYAVAHDFVSGMTSVMREWWCAKALHEARWIPTDLLAFELLRRQIEDQPTHWRRKTAEEIGFIPWTPSASQHLAREEGVRARAVAPY